MKKEKYDMILVECGSMRGPESYIIYKKGGSYIHDEVCQLEGASEAKKKAANKVLDAMNNQ